jgi:hypothetical protein
MKSDVDLTDHPDPAALRPAAMWLRYDSRADGWTPGRRAAFLTHLADNGVVAEAAAAVGKSLASAYALRRRARGYAFNLGWEAALLLARRRVADELMTAAIKGETAVWTREEGKTTYTRFNPRTALALLDRVNPATSLNEVIVVAQHFDRFRDLIDEAADLWPLFDTGLHEADFDVRSRVRINLQLSDESADFEGADKQDRVEPDDEDVMPVEYKSMPVRAGRYLGNCYLGNGGGSEQSAQPQQSRHSLLTNHPRDEPKASGCADRISGDVFDADKGNRRYPPDERQHTKRRHHNRNLPCFYAEVEGEEGDGHFAFGHSDFRKRACEAEAVEQAEEEGDQPRQPFRQARAFGIAFDDFNREEDDRERDANLDGFLAHPDEPKRRADQRDRMRDGEGGHRTRNHPAAAEQQHEAQHEQQMIISCHNMFNAEYEVCLCDLKATRACGDHRERRRDGQPRGLHRTPELRNADKRVADRLIEPQEATLCPDERPCADRLPARDQRSFDQFTPCLTERAPLRQDGGDIGRHPALDRGFELYIPVTLAFLGEFKIAGAQFIGRRWPS